MELSAEVKAARDEILAAIGDFKGAARQEIDAIKQAVANAQTKDGFENLRQQVESIRAELLRPKPTDYAPTKKSIGEYITANQNFREFAVNKDRVFSKGNWSIEIPSDELQAAVNQEIARKTTMTTATVGRATPGILNYERVGGIFAPPQRRIRVRDLIPFSRTEMTGVDYVKENVFTSAASPVAEGSDKAESALTLVIGSAICQTIAHWIPAARQLLADMPRLQTFIETRLLDGLADEEDYQLLRGDGVAPHIAGIIPAATAYAGTYDAASDTRIDKLNHAIAELEANNYEPDGMILNPVDWRVIQVIKTNSGGANTGEYVMGGPGVGLARTLWDLPVSLTNAMEVGKFLVGQFQGSVEGFDRMNAVVDVSTEHSDYFIKNLIAIRVEERVALAIGRPAAFRYGSF